jgi:predicted MFS family arabinose efflux permease
VDDQTLHAPAAPGAPAPPAASARAAAADPGGLRQRLIVPVLAFGGILMALAQTLVVPLLPDLPRLTHSSATDVSWMVTATLVAGAVCTPVLGRAGDMYGKRPMLLGALVVMTLGSALCASTSDIRILIAARALQGAASAVIPLSISILREHLPPDRIASGAAIMSSTVGVGAAFGLPLAGLVVQHADWHVLFWVTTALGALGTAAAWWVVPGSSVRSPGRFDVVGAVGLSVGLVCGLLAVSKGGDWGWTSTRTLGLLAAAAVILVVWGYQQTRTRDPLVDVRLARTPRVLIPHIAALLTGFGFYANSLSTAQLVQAPKETGYGLGLSIVAGGLCLLPGGVCMVLLSPVSARISARRGPKLALALGTGCMAVGYLVRMTTSHDLWTIIVGATVVSSGTALAYSALPTLIMQAVPAEQTAAANGLNVLMRTVGQALCSTVVAVLLTQFTMNIGGHALPTLHAYILVFGVAGLLATAACATACMIPTAKQHQPAKAVDAARA